MENTAFKLTQYQYSPNCAEYSLVEMRGYVNASKSHGGRKGKKASEVSEEDRQHNIQRIKRNVRRLALANRCTVHLVLTFARDIENAGDSDKQFELFIKRFKRIYPKLRYIATREIQEHRHEVTGHAVIHYHVLINQRVDANLTRKVWGHGRIYLKQHRNELQAINYCIKYVVKSIADNQFKTEGENLKKAYLCGQHMKQAVEGCTSRYLINSPEEMEDFSNFVQTNGLAIAWDIDFEIEVPDGNNLKGRSILQFKNGGKGT